jgi:hypothetical protein
MTTLTRQEARAALAGNKRNKYGAVKTVLDGITFDSKVEASYYALLKQREKAGEVANVELQRPFALIAGAGKLVGTYRADFTFDDLIEGSWRVIDVKGHDTPLSRFKRKFVEALHGVTVEVVK